MSRNKTWKSSRDLVANSLKLSHIKLQQSVSEVFQILEECSSSTLEFLSLDGCQLFGHLTDRIGKFKRLYSLKLNDNSVSGPLPMSFGELASLNSVNLARNQINGTIPASFGRLAELEVVNISHNLMEGIVSSEIQFDNLTNLNSFKVVGNRIVCKVKSDWVLPKRLAILDLSSWYIGPGFPKWLLQYVQHLKSLDLSNYDLRNASKLYLCYFLWFSFGADQLDESSPKQQIEVRLNAE
ncbi:Receptor-like protein EIX2 [Linum perenne]